MSQEASFPKEEQPFADLAALQKALRNREAEGRRIVGLKQKSDGTDELSFYDFEVLPFGTPPADLVVKAVPADAQKSKDAYRAFIAPLLNDHEQVCRSIVLIGGKDAEVVVLRPAEKLFLPTDRLLRGDGTWPWFAEVDGADIVIRNAKTTAFGGTDDPEDSGETASGFPTKGNPNFQGCSLPMRYEGSNAAVRSALGGSPIPKMPFGVQRDGSDNPAGAHVKVTDLATGKNLVVPVIDLGPGKRTGHPLDLTVAAARFFRAEASARNFSMRLEARILDGVRLGGLTPAATPLTSTSGAFAERLAAGAAGQFEAFRQLHETHPALRDQIERYWRDLGLDFPGVAEPWSAVFISWNVQQAGAKKEEFKFSARHSVFVQQAIKNAATPGAAFVGRRLTEDAPKVGDLLQNNRDDTVRDFDFAKANADYPSHSAIVVETGAEPNGQRFAITIGGNERDGIRRRKVALAADGKVLQPAPNHFIAIVETRKA